MDNIDKLIENAWQAHKSYIVRCDIFDLGCDGCPQTEPPDPYPTWDKLWNKWEKQNTCIFENEADLLINFTNWVNNLTEEI